MAGAPQTAISTSSSHPWVIQRYAYCHLVNIDYAYFTSTLSYRGVFASHTHALVKSRKELELWEICYNALSKVPKGWSTVSIWNWLVLGSFSPLFVARKYFRDPCLTCQRSAPVAASITLFSYVDSFLLVSTAFKRFLNQGWYGFISFRYFIFRN